MTESLLIDQFFARYATLLLSYLSLCLFGRQEHCQCSIILNYRTIELKSRAKSHMFIILFVTLVYSLFIIVLDPHRMAYKID